MNKERTTFIKIVENLGYIVLASVLAGQIVTKATFLGGQFVYLVANVTAVARAFILCFPRADKIRYSCNLAVTLGLIIYTLIEMI